MRKVMGVVAVVVLASGWVAAQRAGGGGDPVAGSIRQAWQSARLNLKESAEQVPADKLTYKPVESVRNFGAILTHVAGANYVFCSAAKGEAPPHAEDAFEGKVTGHTEIIKVLGESLAYCDTVYNAATDRTLGEAVDQPFGGGKGPRSAALLGNIGHLNEHYGNLVTYFRMNGLVPPSSKR